MYLGRYKEGTFVLFTYSLSVLSFIVMIQAHHGLGHPLTHTKKNCVMSFL